MRLSLVKLATQIERMSSAKLDEVLSSQKPSSDKTGLGYVNSSGLSSSTTSTVFVPQFEKVDKGKKSLLICLILKPLLDLILGNLVVLKLLMFVTIVVFLDTPILIVSSCILISKC